MESAASFLPRVVDSSLEGKLEPNTRAAVRSAGFAPVPPVSFFDNRAVKFDNWAELHRTGKPPRDSACLMSFTPTRCFGSERSSSGQKNKVYGQKKGRVEKKRVSGQKKKVSGVPIFSLSSHVTFSLSYCVV